MNGQLIDTPVIDSDIYWRSECSEEKETPHTEKPNSDAHFQTQF